MEIITSRSNAHVSHVRRLQRDKAYRRASAEMVCEGPKLLEEALKWGARLQLLFYQEACALPEQLPEGLRRIRVPGELLSYLSDTETPQGLLFTCRIPPVQDPPVFSGARYLLLDALQDPGNLGTIWRTADAFGADGLILLPGCADPWGGKAIRASMGACFRLPLWELRLEEALAGLRQAEIPLLATALTADAAEISTLDLSRAAVLIGSESRGVSAQALRASEGTLHIPMEARCESLNAAVAASIVLWEMKRGGAR